MTTFQTSYCAKTKFGVMYYYEHISQLHICQTKKTEAPYKMKDLKKESPMKTVVEIRTCLSRI
jgi:hypothetical protein